MAETNFTVNEIKELMDKFAALKLTELKLKNGDFEMKLEAKKAEACVVAQPAAMPVQSYAPAASVEVNTEEAAAPEISGNVVKSPIVGTFYASAAPDKPPFCEVGKRVKKGDVLFIIESMKLMNEIQSDFAGEVAEILVEDGEAVEYGQPIIVIR